MGTLEESGTRSFTTALLDRAGKWIKLAESLLDAEQLDNTLRDAATALQNAEDFEAEQKKIKQKIHDGIMHGS